MSERCKRMSERTSEWPSAYILVCSRPQRAVCSSKWHSGQALLVAWPELEIVLIWSKIETGRTAWKRGSLRSWLLQGRPWTSPQINFLSLPEEYYVITITIIIIIVAVIITIILSFSLSLSLSAIDFLNDVPQRQLVCV